MSDCDPCPCPLPPVQHGCVHCEDAAGKFEVSESSPGHYSAWKHTPHGLYGLVHHGDQFPGTAAHALSFAFYQAPDHKGGEPWLAIGSYPDGVYLQIPAPRGTERGPWLLSLATLRERLDFSAAVAVEGAYRRGEGDLADCKLIQDDQKEMLWHHNAPADYVLIGRHPVVTPRVHCWPAGESTPISLCAGCYGVRVQIPAADGRALELALGELQAYLLQYELRQIPCQVGEDDGDDVPTGV